MTDTRSPLRQRRKNASKPRWLQSTGLPIAGGAMLAAGSIGLSDDASAAPRLPRAEANGGATTSARLSHPELLVLDASLSHVEHLLRAARPGARIVRLSTDRDGIEQVAEAVTRFGPVSAIHLVTHGSAGSLKLGNTLLTADELDAYEESLAAWFPSTPAPFERRPDLLIYGCNAGFGPEGRRLVEGLGRLTGADVGASLDATGGAAAGGDWELEIGRGEIEASLPFREDAARHYPATLDVFTVWNTNATGPGSLRRAVSLANDNPGADTVIFTDARACPTADPDAGSDAGFVPGIDACGDAGLPAEDGGAISDGTVSGTITLSSPIFIEDDVVIAGPGASVIAVSGSDSTHIFDADASDVAIFGLTLRDGSGAASGGAIRKDGGLLLLEGVDLIDNQSAVSGGAVALLSGTLDSELSLDGCIVTGNQAAVGGGGVEVQGGGSGKYDVGTVDISDTIISENTAAYGGGLLIAGEGMEASVVRSEISGNRATDALGGGILIQEAKYGLSIMNSTVSGNEARGLGSAISADANSFEIVQSTIADNLLYEDEAYSYGGAIPGALYLQISGDGFSSAIEGTIIANNQTVPQPTDAGALDPVDRDLVQGYGGGAPYVADSLIEVLDGLITVNFSRDPIIIGQDPALLPLSDNGGPSRTHALLDGSPAVGRGLEDPGLETDQRGPGFPRVLGGRADIGAYESQPEPDGGLPTDGGASGGGGGTTAGGGGAIAGGGGAIAGGDGGVVGGGSGSTDGDGCGCTVAGEEQEEPRSLPAWVSLLGLGFLWRRHRQRAKRNEVR